MTWAHPTRRAELAVALAHALGPGRDLPRPSTVSGERVTRREGAIWRRCAAVARRVELEGSGSADGPRGQIGSYLTNACAGEDP